MGETPKKGDKSIAACIDKIRNERNLISGHSTAGAIEDNEFQNHWAELQDAIVEKCLTSGNLYERGVDLLLSCDLNPKQSKEDEDEFKRIQGEYISLKYFLSIEISFYNFCKLVFISVYRHSYRFSR